jgi:hypothetical protein
MSSTWVQTCLAATILVVAAAQRNHVSSFTTIQTPGRVVKSRTLPQQFLHPQCVSMIPTRSGAPVRHCGLCMAAKTSDTSSGKQDYLEDATDFLQEEYVLEKDDIEDVPSTSFAPAISKKNRKETTVVVVAVAVGELAKDDIEDVPSTSFAPAISKNFRKETTVVMVALAVGALSGFGVSIFKLSIDFIRQFTYGLPLTEMDHYGWTVAFIPALGGLAVSILRLFENNAPPGLRPQVSEVNAELDNDPNAFAPSKDRSPLSYLRKSMMAIVSIVVQRLEDKRDMCNNSTLSHYVNCDKLTSNLY